MAGVVVVIWVKREAVYFSREGWTGFERFARRAVTQRITHAGPDPEKHVSKDDWHEWGYMVLPAMRSIVWRRRLRASSPWELKTVRGW